MKACKAQTGMMEYIFMSLLVVIVIVILVLFLGWWNAMQLGMEQKRIADDRALFFMKHIISSEYFVKENSVFDDSKLTAATMDPSFCKDFSDVFGSNWYFDVKIIDNNPDIKCTVTDYPDCNHWTFCEPAHIPKRKNIYNIPVNVYRKINETYALALLTVGVYS